MKKVNWFWEILAVFFLAILVYICFWNLGNGNIAKWDEARHGINVYEMLRAGNPIVNTYCYSNDYWNLKPPISYWCIIAGYLLVGFNTWGLRLYAAISFAVAMGITALYLTKRMGITGGASFLCFTAACDVYFFSYGHFVRAGDADALYVSLFTLTMLAMLETDKHPRLLYWCGIGFSLAFLTKSWHAAPIAVIGILYLLFTGKWKRYTVKQYLLFFVITVGPIGVWALCRFFQDGIRFFQGMWEYDLLARTTTGVESQNADFWYYFRYFAERKSLWIVYIIDLIGSLVFIWKRKIQTFIKDDRVVGMFLWITVPILLYSFSTSKRWWYAWASIPGMIFLAACYVGYFCSYVEKKKYRAISWVLPMGLMILFASPVLKNVKAAEQAPGTTGVQTFIADYFSTEDIGKKEKIFVQTDRGDWGVGNVILQDLALEVELYGDCIPVAGGIAAWEQTEESALLLIEEDDMSSYEDELQTFEELKYQDGWYMYYKK